MDPASDVKMCCFFCYMLLSISLRFSLLVEQKKQPEDVTMGYLEIVTSVFPF